jgi:hypothetical protein
MAYKCYVSNVIKLREKRNVQMELIRERSTYRNMMSRCNNPKATGYKYYGGRGIKVCSRWMESFKNFYEDMGDRPNGMSLDRVDVNGDYTKENCRWATWNEQARNTTVNNIITYDGIEMCLEEWAEATNQKSNSILTRLKRGWSVGEALLIEPRQKKLYNGRLSEEELKELIRLVEEDGVPIFRTSEVFGIDPSQCNRLYHRFKTNKERSNGLVSS